MAKLFEKTGGLRPRRSVFNLSSRHVTTGDLGLLYPVQVNEVVPGDMFKMANQVVLRASPMMHPILHEINVYTHTFFVPYRLLWDDWEKFITGGEDGRFETPLPRFVPHTTLSVPVPALFTGNLKNTLWDYLGYPINDDWAADTISPVPLSSFGDDIVWPLDFPRRAYYFIWNEYYRDQNYEQPTDFKSTVFPVPRDIRRRKWAKDYFTSALPWQQRGDKPAIPLEFASFVGSARFDGLTDYNPTTQDWTISLRDYAPPGPGGPTLTGPQSMYNQADAFKSWLNTNHLVADGQIQGSFDVSDLRMIFQTQKFLERNARGGARYTEFLREHFGTAPSDARLQRPEYIGGTKAPVIVSEVLQTARNAAGSQMGLGNMAGHGITASGNHIGKYYVQEYGLIMTILSIMPRAVYEGRIDRQWARETRYDFYFPEFANLSEQEVYSSELNVYNGSFAIPAANREIIGFQGRYNELRYQESMVSGLMRRNISSNISNWLIGRSFGNSAVSINTGFLQCNPQKDWLQVSTEPAFLISYESLIKAVRPMPSMPEPGLIDHH